MCLQIQNFVFYVEAQDEKKSSMPYNFFFRSFVLFRIQLRMNEYFNVIVIINVFAINQLSLLTSKQNNYIALELTNIISQFFIKQFTCYQYANV